MTTTEKPRASAKARELVQHHSDAAHITATEYRHVDSGPALDLLEDATNDLLAYIAELERDVALLESASATDLQFVQSHAGGPWKVYCDSTPTEFGPKVASGPSLRDVLLALTTPRRLEVGR